MDNNIRKSTIRLQWKRFVILGLCYYPCYTSFRGLRDLQSTLNNTAGIGLGSLTVLNACAAIAGLLLPAVVRLKLGTKWSVVIGAVLFAVYTASNYYANIYLLLFIAVLPGIGNTLLWIARGTYTTTVAMDLAAAHERDPAADVALLNGIFFSVSRISTLSGNAISSLVFKKQLTSETLNQTFDLEFCGIRACGGEAQGDNAGALVSPDQSSRNVLVSIYLGFAVAAVLLGVLFLERVPPKIPRTTDKTVPVALTTNDVLYGLMSALRLMKNPRMMMLIPSLIFFGADMAFASGHFTKFFVGCTQGIELVGFVMMSLYVTAVITSPIIGRLVKYVGRVPIFLTGSSLYIAILIVMVVWDPESGKLWHLFGMAISLGFVRAALSLITLTLLGLLFVDQKEAAFGNYCFWQAIGFATITALGVPQFICASHVVAVIMTLLLTMTVLYCVLEFQIRKYHRVQEVIDDDAPQKGNTDV